MGNSLLTIDMITREAVRLWKNSNAFIQNIDRQYDDSFAINGAKIGTSLRIRLPNDYTVRTGPAASVQDTSEQSTTLVVATQNGVDVAFNSSDRTMKMDDYSERVLAPAINNLAGEVAASVMQGSEGGVCNFEANFDGSGAIIAPVATTYLNAKANLSTNSAPNMRRKVVNSPYTDARVVASLAGLFNPNAKISEQYSSGMMRGEALGFDWMEDQTVISHETGTFTAGTVSGADQSGTTLTVNAITGTLNAGDIITIDGVLAVNRITKRSTGRLRQFAVTADAGNGATSLSIYPAIIAGVPNGSGGITSVQYQTVLEAPASGAAINLVNNPGEIYTKNIGFAPEAVTMATADLILPEKGIVEGAREAFDDVSMRMITAYDVGTDQLITRLDVLWGSLWVRPEWACIVADAAN